MARQVHNSQRKQEVVRACFKRMDTAPKDFKKVRQDLGWRHPRRLGGLEFEEHVGWTAVMGEHSRRKGQSGGCVCVHKNKANGCKHCSKNKEQWEQDKLSLMDQRGPKKLG